MKIDEWSHEPGKWYMNHSKVSCNLIRLQVSGPHFILLLKISNYPTAGDMRLQTLPEVDCANDCEDKSNNCKYLSDGAEIYKASRGGVVTIVSHDVFIQEQCS